MMHFGARPDRGPPASKVPSTRPHGPRLDRDRAEQHRLRDAVRRRRGAQGGTSRPVSTVVPPRVFLTAFSWLAPAAIIPNSHSSARRPGRGRLRRDGVVVGAAARPGSARAAACVPMTDPLPLYRRRRLVHSYLQAPPAFSRCSALWLGSQSPDMTPTRPPTTLYHHRYFPRRDPAWRLSLAVAVILSPDRLSRIQEIPEGPPQQNHPPPARDTLRGEATVILVPPAGPLSRVSPLPWLPGGAHSSWQT